MKVVGFVFTLLATAFATKSIHVPVAYSAAARTVYPYATHSAQTYEAEVIPATAVHATVPVHTTVPEGGPSTQYHAQDNLGQYSYGYVTADGQTKVENKAADGTVSGKYSYFDPEGKKVELSYIADEDGFRATGDHLPVEPEVPDVPDELEDAYEKANSRLASARYRAVTTYPQTYSYNVQPVAAPAAYVAYPNTVYPRRGFQYYTSATHPTYQRYVYGTPTYTGSQRYVYGTPTYTGSQRYGYGTPSYTGYQRYSALPAYQYYTTPTGYQYYTAGKPAGYQYYTNSYAPSYRYAALPTSYAPTSYTGAKSGYSRYAYSY